MDHTLSNGNGTISMHSPVPDFFVRWRKFSRRFNLLTWVIISFLMLREIIPEANETLRLIYLLLDYVILPLTKWFFSIIITIIRAFFEALFSGLTK